MLGHGTFAENYEHSQSWETHYIFLIFRLRDNIICLGCTLLIHRISPNPTCQWCYQEQMNGRCWPVKFMIGGDQWNTCPCTSLPHAQFQKQVLPPNWNKGAISYVVLGAPSALLTRNETKRKRRFGRAAQHVWWYISVAALRPARRQRRLPMHLPRSIWWWSVGRLGGSEGKEGLGPPTGGYRTNTA